MSVYNITFDHDLYPGDCMALEFLKAVQDQDGDLAVGDATAVGDFYDRTDSTISAMRTAQKAFWSTGVADAGTTAAITGLSTTTPREFYDGFISDSGGGTGTWQYSNSPTNTQITGQNFAKALRGLYAEGGYTTMVATIWTWLMAGASNAAFAHPAAGRNHSIYLAQTGDYNPRLALTTALLTAGASNATALYDWMTLGLLAPLQSARDLTNFAEAKRTVSKRYRRAYDGVHAQELEFLSLRGKSGLAFQVSFVETVLGASRRVFDLMAAAVIGLAYRENPKIYVTRDHP